MASQLGFSEFNKDDNKNEVLSNMYKKRKNKTLRKRSKITSEKVETFLNSMKNVQENMDDKEGIDSDTEGLADFNPPPNGELTKQPEPSVNNLEGMNNPHEDNEITPEAYENIKNDVMKSYYDSYIPYYNNPQNESVHQNKDELMRKLNYLIHLMEEDKDEPTKNVTEELILYMFLGVFVIFVVDSFARAGKYTR
jgi:hypothetical protein